MVSGTRKFDRGLTQLLTPIFTEHAKYKLCMMMRRCQPPTDSSATSAGHTWSQSQMDRQPQNNAAGPVYRMGGGIKIVTLTHAVYDADSQQNKQL